MSIAQEIRAAAVGQKPRFKVKNVHAWFGLPYGSGFCQASYVVALSWLGWFEYDVFAVESEMVQRTFLLLVAEAMS